MKMWSNNNYNEILKYVLTAIIVTLLLIVTIFQWSTVKNVFSVIFKVFEPIIWGAVIAFIMNPIMMSCEKFLKFIAKKLKLKKEPSPKILRAVGVLFATAVFLLVIASIILSVIPEITSNIPGIYNGLVYDLLPKVQERATQLLKDYPSIEEIVLDELSNIGTTVQRILAALVPQLNNLLSSLLSVANSIKNFVFGVIFAIYFLLNKEALQAQAKKLIVALFSEKTAATIFRRTTDTNSAFLNFIYGKVIDSIIIGIICGVCMLIFRMPYAMLISIIIGITNIIPIFGPFIGAIPSAILILIAEPKKTIWFVLFVIALQQLDGNIIGPRILGKSVGITPFWMLFSIIVFGSMFGIAGMIVGVPLFAVCSNIIKANVNDRLKSKNLPTDDERYMVPSTELSDLREEDSEKPGESPQA